MANQEDAVPDTRLKVGGPDALTLTVCVSCNRTDRWSSLKARHYGAGGGWCPGPVREVTYLQLAEVRDVLDDRVTKSLPLADWAIDPLPSCPQYSHVNPDWLRAIIAEARAVRAALDA